MRSCKTDNQRFRAGQYQLLHLKNGECTGGFYNRGFPCHPELHPWDSRKHTEDGCHGIFPDTLHFSFLPISPRNLCHRASILPHGYIPANFQQSVARHAPDSRIYKKKQSSPQVIPIYKIEKKIILAVAAPIKRRTSFLIKLFVCSLVRCMAGSILFLPNPIPLSPYSTNALWLLGIFLNLKPEFADMYHNGIIRGVVERFIPYTLIYVLSCKNLIWILDQ